MPNDLDAIDLATLLRRMPHRFPMLFVDGMEACRPRVFARTYKNVSNDEPQVSNHNGPETKLHPLLMLEGLAQTAGILCYFSGMLPNASSIAFLASIRDFTIVDLPAPGDRLIYDCQFMRAAHALVKVQCTATVRNHRIAGGILTLALRPNPAPFA